MNKTLKFLYTIFCIIGFFSIVYGVQIERQVSPLSQAQCPGYFYEIHKYISNSDTSYTARPTDLMRAHVLTNINDAGTKVLIHENRAGSIKDNATCADFRRYSNVVLGDWNRYTIYKAFGGCEMPKVKKTSISDPTAQFVFQIAYKEEIGTLPGSLVCEVPPFYLYYSYPTPANYTCLTDQTKREWGPLEIHDNECVNYFTYYCGDGRIDNNSVFPRNDPRYDPLDPSDIEQCDDGNNIDGDGCNAQCENESCDNLTVTPANGPDPLTSTLTCSATNAISYRIEIRDGGGALMTGVNSSTLTYTFPSAGTYHAKCTINGFIPDTNCEKDITVEDLTPSCDSLTIFPITGDNPLDVNFICAGTNVTDYRIEIYSGVNLLTGVDASTCNYTFVETGVYEAACYIDGLTTTPSACQGNVAVEEPTPSCDSLNINPSSGAPGTTVSFDCTGTLATTYDIEIYSGGTYLTGISSNMFSYTFDDVGAYSGKCIVNGSVSSPACEGDIDITDQTTCDLLTIDPSFGDTPLDVDFECSGTNVQTGYRIDIFNTGGLLTSINNSTGSYTFALTGIYTGICYVDNTITDPLCEGEILVGTGFVKSCDSLTKTIISGVSPRPPLGVHFYCTGTNTNDYRIELSNGFVFQSNTGTYFFNIDGTYTATCYADGLTGAACVQTIEVDTPTCFPQGTQIKMGDGTDKNIEDVKEGDIVTSYNEKLGVLQSARVAEIESPVSDHMCQVDFSDGSYINFTKEHPIYTKDGWKAIDETAIYNLNPDFKVELSKLEIGDQVLFYDNNYYEVIAIDCWSEDIQTYNLMVVEKLNNFYADNILVHNKSCFLPGTKITMEDGSFVNIEDIHLGDRIIAYNEVTGEQEAREVLELQAPIREGYFKLYFGDDRLIKVTDEHPFYAKKKDGSIGRASIVPSRTHEFYPYLDFVVELEVGDKILDQNNNWQEVQGMYFVKGPVLTYNIWSVEANHNYYANGLLVHNRNGSTTYCGDGKYNQSYEQCEYNQPSHCPSGSICKGDQFGWTPIGPKSRDSCRCESESGDGDGDADEGKIGFSTLSCRELDPPSVQLGEFLPIRWKFGMHVKWATTCNASNSGAYNINTTNVNLLIKNGTNQTNNIQTKAIGSDGWNLLSTGYVIANNGPTTETGFDGRTSYYLTGIFTSLGEYSMQLNKVIFQRCEYDSIAVPPKWEWVNGTYTGTACQHNFAVTRPYLISRGTTFATTANDALGDFYLLSGDRIIDPSYINNVSVSNYSGSDDLEFILTDFYNSYVNLANTTESLDHISGTLPNKVGNEKIYIYNGDISTNGDVIFPESTTVIVKGGNFTISNNISGNVMFVVPDGEIYIESGDCNQPINLEGFYFAKEFDADKIINDVPTNYKWCNDGRLIIKGTLAGSGVDKLINNRRSALNNFFRLYYIEDRREEVFDGGSLLLYPNQDLWSDLPPGADDLLDKLNIEKK